MAGLSLIATGGVALATEPLPADEDLFVGAGVDPSRVDSAADAGEAGSSEPSGSDTVSEESDPKDGEAKSDPHWRIHYASNWGLDSASEGTSELLAARVDVLSDVNRDVELVLEDKAAQRTGRFWVYQDVLGEYAAPYGTYETSAVIRCYRYYDTDDDLQKFVVPFGQPITLDHEHPHTQVTIPASVLNNDPCAKIHGNVTNFIPEYGVNIDLWVKQTSGEFGFFAKSVSVLNNEFGFEGLAAGEYQIRVNRVWLDPENASIYPNGAKENPRVSNDQAAARFANPYCPVELSVNAAAGQMTEANIALEPTCALPLPEADPIVSGTPELGNTVTAEVSGLNTADYDSVEYYWYIQRFYGTEDTEGHFEELNENKYLVSSVSSQTLTLDDEHAGRLLRVLVKATKDDRVGYMLSASVQVAGEVNRDYDGFQSGEYPAVEASVEAVGQGGAVEFVATGFVPGEPVTFVVHSEPVTVGTVPADQSGRAAISWVVPAGFELGEHRVIATGLKSGRSSVDLFEVRAASSTGNLWSWLVGLGSGSTSANGGAGSSSAAGSASGSVVGAGVNAPGASVGTSSSAGAQTAGDAGKDGSVASANGSADVDAKVSVKVVAKGMPVTGADATTVVAVAALLLAAGAGMTLRRVNR